MVSLASSIFSVDLDDRTRNLAETFLFKPGTLLEEMIISIVVDKLDIRVQL